MESDFASAAMMRLVAAGLARQRLPMTFTRSVGAHLPLGEKRGVLDALLAKHGCGPLLRIADAVSELAHEPLLKALLRAPDVADLFDRWHRLEVFSHSRHRLEITPSGSWTFEIAHYSRVVGTAPSRAETLLVVAVVSTLAEMVSGSAIRLIDGSGRLVRKDRAWIAMDALLPPFSLHVPPCGSECRAPIGLEKNRPGLDAEIRCRIADDPLRRWSVARMAATLGLSPRSLQRHLSRCGRSFTVLVSEARLGSASEMLCNDTCASLAEIGFRSGYADQSHMSREFRRAVGIPPARFRAVFAAKVRGRGLAE